MTSYKFTVYSEKNPIPYKRTTQNSKWCLAYRSYAQWKKQIQLDFHNAYPEVYPAKLFIVRETRVKPFIGQGPFEVIMRVYYRDKSHGDTDNVAKGINDALFQTDKFVFGRYSFCYDRQKPRVEVLIRQFESFKELEEQWESTDLDAIYAIDALSI